MIDLGGLPPHDLNEGGQVRLNTLGHATPDEEKGKPGPGTRRALRDFQTDHQIPVTGVLDDVTRDRLRTQHKSEVEVDAMPEPRVGPRAQQADASPLRGASGVARELLTCVAREPRRARCPCLSRSCRTRSTA